MNYKELSKIVDTEINDRSKKRITEEEFIDKLNEILEPYDCWVDDWQEHHGACYATVLWEDEDTDPTEVVKSLEKELEGWATAKYEDDNDYIEISSDDLIY